MTDRWESIASDDEELLAALRRALGARRDLPAEFVRAAKEAFAWRDIDAELADLTYDSVYGPDLAARTRAEDAAIRALTFSSPHVTIELEVTAESLLGQVIPTQIATIEIHTQAGVTTVVSSDEIGCFSVQPVPRGTFRMHCLAQGGIAVRTGWITL